MIFFLLHQIYFLGCLVINRSVCPQNTMKPLFSADTQSFYQGISLYIAYPFVYSFSFLRMGRLPDYFSP